jgi:2'-5' RNA ligase superfamily
MSKLLSLVLTLVQLALLLCCSCVQVLSLQLNIHLPLTKVNNSWAFDKCPYNFALEANLALRQASATEQIDFFSRHTPHITLFLSDFSLPHQDTNPQNESLLLEEITAILQQVVATANANANGNHSQTSMCQVSFVRPLAAAQQVVGPYSMYAVPRTECLQKLSDSIVHALNPYITRPQPIPEWVYQLPLLPRWRKIYMISKYGSPNVLGEYDPHVTVGYDEGTLVSYRTNVLREIPSPSLECTALLTHVGIAKVGIGGSVLQDGLVSEIRLPDPTSQDE